jgi:hypothetical protein
MEYKKELKIDITQNIQKPFEEKLSTIKVKIDFSEIKDIIKDQLLHLSAGEVVKVSFEGIKKYEAGIAPQTVFSCLKELDSSFNWDWEDDNGWQNDVWGSCVFLGKNYNIFYGSYYGHFEIVLSDHYEELAGNDGDIVPLD